MSKSLNLFFNINLKYKSLTQILKINLKDKFQTGRNHMRVVL